MYSKPHPAAMGLRARIRLANQAVANKPAAALQAGDMANTRWTQVRKLLKRWHWYKMIE
jgi:hypothetical protein